MLRLESPLSAEDIAQLKVGDEILLSGTIFTARDKAHKHILENDFSKIANGIIYHCGPIVKENRIISAGPTTSSRMNPYTPKVIEKYAVRAIIGKGGMDSDVLRALRGKAVYLSAVGGAGVLYANLMHLKNVFLSEFGMPEAVWELEVRDFPAIVSMDSHGNSLYEEIKTKSREKLLEMIK